MRLGYRCSTESYSERWRQVGGCQVEQEQHQEGGGEEDEGGKMEGEENKEKGRGQMAL